MWWRKKLWRRRCNVRRLKPWCYLCQNRSSPRRDSSNRERKRLAVAEEALIAAVKNRDESLEALAQGEKRFQELQSQEKSPFAGHVTDAEAELVRLRAQVAELQGRAEMSVVSVIPADAMPGFPAELSAWTEDRQKDLQEALSTGDHSHVVKLSLMLTKGAERMVEMTRQDISDDEFRSRAAPRRGAVRSFLKAGTSRCHARYGLRAKRVGEASHPGPRCFDVPEQGVAPDVRLSFCHLMMNQRFQSDMWLQGSKPHRMTLSRPR